SGWKHPALNAASASAPKARISFARAETVEQGAACFGPARHRAQEPSRAVPLSCHHIDDPLRNDDHFLGRPAIERPFYRIERQNSGLDLGIGSIASDCDIAALPTIDLDRKCDRVLDQKIRLELGPSL